MSKRQKKQSRPHPSAPADQRPPLLFFAAVIAGLLVVALATLKFLGQKSDDQTYVRRPKGTVTYTRDIAPIIYEQCLTCHRPGESAHLDLVSYSDAKKYAKLISKVVASGYMPPWLPEPGFGEFLDERRLTPDQIGLIQQWAAEAAVEGNPADLPPPPEGLSWVLHKNTDMVVQLHMRPGDKPETLQPSIGLFFTDKPPVKEAFKIILDAPTLDIPAGEKNYVATDLFTLPVDVEAYAVFPHAHYLAREMQGFATLPDGTKKWLLRIKQWDFDWQGDYRFKQPVFLPKGTTLSMQFSYDNSTENVRNPNNPPRRVLFGPQTTDEMGELWIQAVPRSREDFNLLTEAYNQKELRKVVVVSEQKLKADPRNAGAHLQLGKALIPLQRGSEALQHFRAAAEIEPRNDLPHYFMGVAYRLQQDLPHAKEELQAALQLNPENYKTHGNLAHIYLEQGDISRAQFHFENALRINPEDALARSGLQEIANLQK